MKRILLSILFVVSMLASFGQTVSNEGRDFWAVFPTHDPANNSPAQIVIFVTSKFDTEATVTVGGISVTKPVLANNITEFLIDRAATYIAYSEANISQTNRGIHISVPLNKPKVAAYAHIYASARSAASLILPVDALGQSYYSMNYTQTGTQNATTAAASYLTVVAVEDNTDLIIHTLSGENVPVHLNNAGDVYEYIANDRGDLTGTYVEVDNTTSACKRFAAFSGSTSLYIGCSGSQDPLYQQLYAPNSWGKTYGVVSFKDRRYITRVLAKSDTQVTINGTTTFLTAGKYIESGQMTQPSLITADQPVCVAQYSLTQGCSGAGGASAIGDPEMVILNPVEFGLKNITMFSSNREAIQRKYINVYMKSAAVGSFKVNGVAPSETWNPMPEDPNFSYIQIETTKASLTLTAADTFNAIAYGFGSVESYAYSAGTSLAAFQFLTITDKATDKKLDNACIGATYKLSITIPIIATKLTWQFLDGSPDVVDNSPIPLVATKDGQNIYTYVFSGDKTFTATGNSQVIIQVESASGSGCSAFGGPIEYRFDLVINPIPQTDFTADGTNCNGQGVTFTDASLSNSTTVILDSWIWDFGDGATSTEQNPTHIYTDPGSYIVKLSSGVTGGCFNSIEKTVIVHPTPEAKFNVKSNLCVGLNVVIKDQSIINTIVDPNNKIVEWRWDFGDGTPIETSTTPSTPNHAYVTAGTYAISLTVVSSHGCVSAPFSSNETIVPLPVPDFTLPGFCLDDKDAHFTNKSLNSDGTTNNLSYSWDFGDTGTPDNTSTDVDGKHQYTKVGNYTVSLTIRNLSEGCSVTKQQTFTVNGSVDKALFSIKNDNDCVKNDIIINNASTAFAGNITKIDIYKDFINNPNDFFSIINPTGADIPLQYSTFGGNVAKQFTIRMIAYSGEALTCQKEISKVVTVKPSPQLTFLPIPSACLNDGTITLSQASETSGMNGTGVYNGTGLTSGGLFNPLVAGIGVHTIAYTFTAANSCSESITQTIEVFESPTVDAGNDKFIFEGGELPMNATTTGAGIVSYKWSPAEGLSDATILNPVVKPLVDAVYTLTITNQNGCAATDNVFVTVLKEIKPFNSFSPNGDGINDVWTLLYINSYPQVTVEIFNRNGNRVFYSKGYGIPFDGKYKGAPLPVGTYYYLINPGSGRKTIAGDVTIIR